MIGQQQTSPPTPTMDSNLNDDETNKAMSQLLSFLDSQDFESARQTLLKVESLRPSSPRLEQLRATVYVNYFATTTKPSTGAVDWFAVLCLKPPSDPETIRKRYRLLCFLTHPNKNPFPAATSAFNYVTKAYNILSKGFPAPSQGNPPGARLNAPKRKLPDNFVSSAKMGTNPQGPKHFRPACPICNVLCACLDDRGLTIWCHWCNLVAVRQEKGGASRILIGDRDRDFYGGRNVRIKVHEVDGESTVLIQKCDGISTRRGCSDCVSQCDNASAHSSRSVNIGRKRATPDSGHDGKSPSNRTPNLRFCTSTFLVMKFVSTYPVAAEYTKSG